MEVARRLVEQNSYLTLATADADGRPWASPVWFASPSDGVFLWVSAPDSRHSRNIAARPDIAIVIFDSTVPVGGAEALYADAVAEEVAEAEVADAVAAYSRASEAAGARAWVSQDVLPPAPLRLYRATATEQSVLGEGDRRLPRSA